jgi:hypothetical protein
MCFVIFYIWPIHIAFRHPLLYSVWSVLIIPEYNCISATKVHAIFELTVFFYVSFCFPLR